MLIYVDGLYSVLIIGFFLFLYFWVVWDKMYLFYMIYERLISKRE